MAGQVNYSAQYDVFLSYRRDGGETMAVLLRDRLAAKGYRVFLDVESLNPGSFNEQLLDVIEHCTDFLMVCSKNSLKRCKNESDWVRREIAQAFQCGKNIIPFMLRGFQWPRRLPDDIAKLPMQNGVTADSNVYFDAAIELLCSTFLKSKPGAKTPERDTPKPDQGSHIFICYAYKDLDRVSPFLVCLRQEGYRFWFEEGIDPGAELFPQAIAENLESAAFVMLFMSGNAAMSRYTRREIVFAQKKRIPIVVVFLEEMHLPADLELQLCTSRQINGYQTGDKKVVLRNLFQWELFEKVR